MLMGSYFVWKQNKEWYELYDVDEETGEYKIRLTDKAPLEAVESFQKWMKVRERAQREGIIY